MASCITSQWANSYSPQVRLTVTQSSSTATTATLHWVAEYVAHGYAADIGSRTWSGKVGSTSIGGTFAAAGITGTKTMGSGDVTITKTTAALTIIFSISFPFNMSWSSVSTTTRSASGSISVAAKTKYTILYNANGGSGAPAAQSKWHGTAITLSSTKPTRTGYTFQGWGTSASDTSVDYAAGASYTANANATLYAIWKAVTYAVKFDANGGTGAPGNQTKTYGVTLKLSSTKPTRTNYNFKGWGTSKSATTVSYAAGANYTTNAGITLYAIWELAYLKPRILNLSVDRCLEDSTIDENGTYARLKFKWNCDRDVSSITVSWVATTGESGSTTISASDTSGTVDEAIGNGVFSVETSYTLSVTVADSGGSFSKSTFLNGLEFPIDVYREGKGIAFGKPAELAGVADFGYDAKFNKNVYGNAVGLRALPQIPANSDLNSYIEHGCYAVSANANAATIANMPVPYAGRIFVADAIGVDYETGYLYRRQTYIPYNLTNARYERDLTRNADGVWTYGRWYTQPHDIIALYNVSVSFTAGVATYTDARINTGSFVMVQTRSSTNTNNRGYTTSSNSGSVTIGTDGGLNATIFCNILIINP